jgi:hypothetical protein
VIAERAGELYVDGLLVAHEDAEAMAVVAGGLLFARALIVGGGRFVAAAAALLHTEVSDIHVCEPRLELWDRFGQVGGRPGIAVHRHECRVEDLVAEARFDSIFYDPWPAPIPEAALATGRVLKPQGRLIFWRGTAAPEDFGVPLELEAALRIRSPELLVYRREPQR